MTAVLEARRMCTGYAGQPVVHDLDLVVGEGEVVCLLGPNGAGKTTTMLALSGELPVISGEVMFGGRECRDPLYRRAQDGLSYVTEERSVFKALSTRDNFRVAGLDPKQACRLFPELEKRLSVRGGLLSGGEQQMLTLARALARKPRMLLADELSLGLAPLVVDRLLQAVRAAAKEDGTGVLMVEQHAHKALQYSDRAIVMRRGRVSLSLSGEEARARISEVEQAYLTTGSPAAEANEAVSAPAHADVSSPAPRDTPPPVPDGAGPPRRTGSG
jgi:branched-chain amino acid transport system ATP-binding protein